jgi:hypothetical protein
MLQRFVNISRYYYLLTFFTLPFFTLTLFSKTLINNFNFYSNFSSLMFFYNLVTSNSTYTNYNSNKKLFVVQDFSNDTTNTKNNFLESSQNIRYNRFFNVLINYDYKTGHYIGNWEQQYPFLYTSFIEVARGIRKPA